MHTPPSPSWGVGFGPFESVQGRERIAVGLPFNATCSIGILLVPLMPLGMHEVRDRWCILDNL